MITKHMARPFGVVLFYATCDECKTWIKEPTTGQFVWEARSNRDRNAMKHAKYHELGAII
jgi:hypothetical protein